MSRIGYVLKVYPRFSETFVVTELLGREAVGDDLRIYALRPTTDARFHPEIAKVVAPVTWIPRPRKASALWEALGSGLGDAVVRESFAAHLPTLATLPGDEVGQGVALAERVLADGVTHLHAHFASLAGRTTWVASRLTGVPFTVTTHAKDIFHESVDQDWLRRIATDADRVIAISAFNHDHLQRVLAGTGARLTHEYNALDLDRFAYHEPDAVGEPLKVAAVGRLVPKKGFADLIAAAARCQASGRRLEVRIAGAGELAEDLQHQVTASGLGDVVSLLGPRTQNEVRDLVRWADVFAAPCVPSDDGNVDGLPTVVLEAMALGTPVVATAVTGLPEVVHDGRTGVLLEPGDVDGLARALDGFAAARLPAAQFARAARRLMEERFDHRRHAATLSAWQSGQGAS